MNKFWKAYFGALFILMGFTIASVGVSGCKGFINPVVDAERTFKEDVKKDIKILHEKIDGIEDRIEKAVKDAVKDIVGCTCDPNKVCNCGDKPAPVIVDQWYQSREYANIYYWGHIVDGVLYYTYIYDSTSGGPPFPARRFGAIAPGKTRSNLPDNATKEFNPTPVKGMAPAK
jgi:hypothetical protein